DERAALVRCRLRLPAGVEPVGDLVDGARQLLAGATEVGLDLGGRALGLLLIRAHWDTPALNASMSRWMLSLGCGVGPLLSMVLPTSAATAATTSTTPATISAAAQPGSARSSARYSACSSQPSPNSPNTPATASSAAPAPTALPFSASWACASWISSRTNVDIVSVIRPTSWPSEGSPPGRGVVSVTVSTPLHAAPWTGAPRHDTTVTRAPARSRAGASVQVARRRGAHPSPRASPISSPAELVAACRTRSPVPSSYRAPYEPGTQVRARSAGRPRGW